MKIISRQKIRAKLKRTDEKEEGLRKGILPVCFSRRRRGQGGKRRCILRQQKDKAEKFSSLKEKLKKEGGAPKNEGKKFLLCSPQGDRRRWVGSAPVRAQIVAQRRFERRLAIARR
jgi:hypothetical protein